MSVRKTMAMDKTMDGGARHRCLCVTDDGHGQDNGRRSAAQMSVRKMISLLNFRFVLHLQEALPNHDATRAAYMGKFHALVNAASGVLQLFRPMSCLLCRMKVYRVWVGMPVMLLVLTCLPSVVMTTNDDKCRDDNRSRPCSFSGGNHLLYH